LHYVCKESLLGDKKRQMDNRTAFIVDLAPQRAPENTCRAYDSSLQRLGVLRIAPGTDGAARERATSVGRPERES